MKKRFFLITVSLFLFLSFLAQAFVSEVDENHPFQVSFDDEVPLALEAPKVTVDVFYSIPKNHHLYRDSIHVEIENDGVTAEMVTPNGVLEYDDFMADEVEVYYNQLVALLTLNFSKDYDFTEPLKGVFLYQGCSDKICFRTVKVPFEFQIDDQNPSALFDNGSTEISAEKFSLKSLFAVKSFQELLSHGFWLALLITFLAGFLTGLTPCVLPVIPLTLSFIGVTTEAKSSQKIFHLLIFVLGMSLMYTLLGLLSASLGLTLGFFYQQTWFLVFLIIFLVLMALWLLDVFHWQLPSAFQQKILQIQPNGILRFFYAGLTIGLLAAPCVGPIIGPLLVYISVTGNLWLGFWMMLSYALGLGVLFFVLGFASHKGIQKLGQTGGRYFKKILGILLIITALYFLFVLFNTHTGLVHQKNDFFVDDLEQARHRALAENKSILVDFYADWCVPCHEWDQKIWKHPAVQQAVSEHYIPVKIDCTQETEACEAAVTQYQIVGWPTILCANSHGEEKKNSRLVGILMEPQEFIKYLEENCQGE